MNAPVKDQLNSNTDVLISIKPKYVEKILQGEKKFEFRKTIFKRENIRKVFIYSSAPVQKIVASFEIEEIFRGHPKEIWNSCKKGAGISEDAYFDYFADREYACSIQIKNLHRFQNPVSPYEHIPNFVPPQSYMFVNMNLQRVLSIFSVFC